MSDIQVFLLASGAVVTLFFFILFISGRSNERQVHEARIAKATAIAAREAARASVEAASAMAIEKERGKVRLAGVGLLVVVVLFVWAGFSVASVTSEWGTTSRYRARQSTYIELDMGKTVRQGQLMEMMTNRAWADAYVKTGGPPKEAGVPWGLLSFSVAFFGLAWFLYSRQAARY